VYALLWIIHIASNIMSGACNLREPTQHEVLIYVMNVLENEDQPYIEYILAIRLSRASEGFAGRSPLEWNLLPL
jgi:hypothetical protein